MLSSPVALKGQGLEFGRVDGVILSHLHGDHFGGLVFLLLDEQLLQRRTRPLLIAGPPTTRTRIEAALEVFFPKAASNQWRFPFEIMEIEPGRAADVLGHAVLTAKDAEVLRPAVELYQDLTQILRLCLPGKFDPKTAGSGLLRLFARAADVPDFATLEATVIDTQAKVRESFVRILGKEP